MRRGCFERSLIVLLLAGCGSAAKPDAPVDATLSPVVLPALPAASTPRPLESPTVTLKRDLCRQSMDRASRTDPTTDRGAEPKCALAKVRDLGNETYVAVLYRGPHDWKLDGSNAAELGMTSEGDTDTFGVDFQSCGMFEYWLATIAEGRLAKTQLITEICNDGHGAAGVGEDVVTVTPGQISVARHGGSSWRWDHRERFSLPALSLLDESIGGYWAVSTNSSSTEWSWTERRGKTDWLAPRCTAREADPEAFRYALVPAFADVPALAGDAWKSVSSLEGCATSIDGEHAGEMLAGAPSPASAQLALVVAGGALFVEISDDKLVLGGSLRDELEIWHRKEPAADWSNQCLEAPVPASGTAIQLGDLSTRLLGDKTGRLLDVERAPARAGAPMRLRVALPLETAAVTVVYRDTDDGKRHARTLSSSALDAKNAATLGALHRIAPERASCEVGASRLELRMKPHTDASSPVARP